MTRRLIIILMALLVSVSSQAGLRFSHINTQNSGLSYDGVRWASARYYGRQYVSRTNLAYFAGHWETFAGVGWKLAEQLKLSVNFVNVLFQNGSKGSIDVADTITDASILQGYVMSGSYIRPFTIDFLLTYRF